MNKEEKKEMFYFGTIIIVALFIFFKIFFPIIRWIVDLIW